MDAVLVTSRSAAEYAAMFGLAAGDLAGGSVLDCCAGGSSFTAQAGARAVAVDPAYALGHRELAARVRAALPGGDRMISDHAGRFDWSWYGSPARRAGLRTAAARRFLADLREYPGRYLAAALPRLPFRAARFDLVLCSHLLFTWSNQLDEDWHRQALTELLRVSRQEVRVFPLVVQGTGDPVPFLAELGAHFRAAGHSWQLRRVPYRFQQGADQMLVIGAR